MNIRRVQFVFSLLFIVGYIGLIAAILYVEVSDTLNMKKGANSMMGELKILMGVLTAGVAQILNFWFNDAKLKEAKKEEMIKLTQKE